MISNCRLTNPNGKWLYYDETSNEWVVMKHYYRKKKASELIRTVSEELAVRCFSEE